MKMFNTNNLPIIRVALATLLATQLFQNCGQMGKLEALDMSSNLSLGSGGNTDLIHPGNQAIVPPTQKTLIVNRTYVAALMREIFTRTSGPVPNLEALIHQWIINRGSQYGLGCNPYDTYSGRDCGGDITNANLPTNTEDSAVRESYRLQFCENILGQDESVYAIIEKLSSPTTAPTYKGLVEVYGLFYRGDGPSQLEIDSLMDLDRALAEKNEAPIDRWRAAALQICESSAWQLQ